MLNKQKIIALASVLALTANSVNADIIDSVTEYEDGAPAGSKKIVIEGTIPVPDNNDTVGKSVTLEIIKPGIDESDIDSYGNGDEFEYVYQTQANDDGEYKFEYIKSSATGNYLVRIGYNTRGENNLNKKIHEYVSPQDYIDFDNALDNVFSKVNDENSNACVELVVLIDEYTEKGVLNIEKYNELKQQEKNDKIEFVCEYILSMPKTDSIEDITGRFNEGYVISLMNNAEAVEIQNVLENEFCMETLKIDETVILNFADYKDKNKIYDKLAGCDVSGKTIDEVRKTIYNAIILQEFDRVMYQTNLDVIKKYNSVLNVNFDGFESLKDEKKENAALVSFTDKVSNVKDIDDIAEVFDEAVKVGSQHKEKNEAGSDNRKNNSSGSGGGGVNIIPALVPNQIKNETNEEDTKIEPTQKPAFDDIESFAWASEAISVLADKNIIVGDGKGKFNPDKTVKREEFVKMVILALGLNERAEKTTFNDVRDDEWYYEYVQGAVYYNIISGMSDGRFGVGENIKRADVAVILERLLKMYGKEYSVKDIAYSDVLKDKYGYAYESIYKVAESKLMSGTSETTFEPGRGITRAETAVVIYRLMNLLENN